MSDRPSESELAWADAQGHKIGPIDGSVIRKLVAEVRRLRGILDGIYDVVQETKGREEQLAELEREVIAIRSTARAKKRKLPRGANP